MGTPSAFYVWNFLIGHESMWQKADNPILNQIDLLRPQPSPKVAPKFCPSRFFAVSLLSPSSSISTFWLQIANWNRYIPSLLWYKRNFLQNLLNPFGQNTLLFTLSQKRCVPCDNITNVTKICWYSHFLISWFIAMKQYDIVAKPKSWKLLGTERTLSGTGTVLWPEFSWTSTSGGSADQNQIPSCSARVGRSSKTLNHPSSETTTVSKKSFKPRVTLRGLVCLSQDALNGLLILDCELV